MRKIWVVPLCGILILGVAAYCGYRAYAHWEPERLVKKARESLKKNDYAAAALQLRRALQINAGNVSATRLAADMLEAGGQPDALRLRAHVLDLAPNSTDDKFAWLVTAIRFSQPVVAQKALTTFTDAEKKTPAFESSSGALSASQGKYDEALKHYAEAVRLDPNNQSDQFNYAMMQMQSLDLDVRQEGINKMKALSENATYSISARRTLIGFFVANKNLQDALQVSETLIANPKAEFLDRLTHLDILDRLGKPNAPVFLAGLKIEAAKAVRDAGLLINWLQRRGRITAAIEWARMLPKNFTSMPQCGAILADCYLAMKQWQELEKLTKQAKWNEFEFLRCVLLSRAQRETDQYDASIRSWRSALEAAAESRTSLGELRAIVAAWGSSWEAELSQVDWALGERWADISALKRLYIRYAKVSDTSHLCDITKLLTGLEPANKNIANNFAIFSLLLRKNLPDAMKIAVNLYESEPQNPVFVSTYAFGLHQQGLSSQGLKVMESLDPGQLKEPSVAMYYGVLLTANNMRTKALEYLQLSKQEKNLLPEEKELIENTIHEAIVGPTPKPTPRPFPTYTPPPPFKPTLKPSTTPKALPVASQTPKK